MPCRRGVLPCCRRMEYVSPSSSEDDAASTDIRAGRCLVSASAVPPMSLMMEMGPAQGEGPPSPPMRSDLQSDLFCHSRSARSHSPILCRIIYTNRCGLNLCVLRMAHVLTVALVLHC